MTENAIAVVHNKKHFDDAVKQRAFLYWMWECESSIPLTASMLQTQEAQDALIEGREPRKTPDVDTIRYWHRQDDWPAMRHASLVKDDTAGALYNYAIGKHLLMLDKATTLHNKLLDLPLTEPVLDKDGAYIGEKPSTALSTIYKAIEGVYTVAKLIGRAPIEGDAPPRLKPTREKRDTTNRTPEQIQKERMDRMKALKQPRRGKG